MTHKLGKTEAEHGLLIGDFFSDYPAEHQFEGIYIETADGSVWRCTNHKPGTKTDDNPKGIFKLHKTVQNRLDGLTEIYRECDFSEGTQIDVSVQDNWVVLREVV